MFEGVALVVAAVLVLAGVLALVAVGGQVARMGAARVVQFVNASGVQPGAYVPPGSR